MGAEAVRFAGVVKHYGAITALAGASFACRSGETVALLGPNGAGKSTSVAVMLGLLSADEGAVSVLGGLPRAALRAGRLGAMLQAGQGAGLLAGVRVRHVVRLAGRLYPRPMPLGRCLEQAGLAELAGRAVESLSGGEQQRVRFAMAIAGDPELLFLDEPTVGMDVEARRGFWATMRALAGEGRTLVFATHYLEEADAAADRVVVLHRGQVVAEGTPAELKATVATATVRLSMPGADPGTLAGLAGVARVEARGEEITLSSTDADATAAALYASGLAFSHLEVTRASLEEAFVSLVEHRDSPGPAARPPEEGS